MSSETLKRCLALPKGSSKEKEILGSLNDLEAPTRVCRGDKGKLEVENPYLTKQQVKQLKSIPGTTVSIPRLIQFLRMHLPMDEGQYNELYLLSNCPCHSHGWIFLVLDRVLIAGKIEICDVLAYNEIEASYFTSRRASMPAMHELSALKFGSPAKRFREHSLLTKIPVSFKRSTSKQQTLQITLSTEEM